MKLQHVFVYGSLKRGFSNHGVLGNSPFVGEAVTAGRYAMLSAGAFPVVLPVPGHPVEGEVYACDAATMDRLDRLEGNGRLYQRELVSVIVDDEDGGPLDAWVYFGLGPWQGCPPVQPRHGVLTW